MQNLKIAALQAHQAWENKRENLKHFELLLLNLEEDVDILFLPEMFHTGFTMNVEELGETMEESTGINWLRKIAEEKQCAVCTSLIVRELDYFYNRLVFITPDHKLFHYDKNQLFTLANEDDYFTPGSHNKIVEYKGWKINLQVCYDLRFPENVRNKVEEDGSFMYDALIYVANWPERRSHHWKTLLQARAIENQVYVAGCNRVGKDDNEITYSGDSMLVNPLGEVEATSNEEEILYSIWNWEKLSVTRDRLAFLKDRTR
ncbi:Predicted amidohydrolase [Lishizhenia tianjinensis]|uniref:Predicted amidohydrolase n=1 Tax=Lishizhenia tianjinensis TaxID=477690 RepID=A0A1I6ZQ84_9FLAO|nr:nitrilase-related carbon-nitrogen hydrolase [Lishizhenia tianjinensis]SFT64790.1 Predicted amidohydrolase [Lishizhenia tianjinensis]